VLWQAIPASNRPHLPWSNVRVLVAELDGEPPGEAILAVEHPGERNAPAASLYVLRPNDATWALVGQDRFQASWAWDGFYDDRPGLQAVRADRLLGDCRDAVRVEWLDVQGGMDPRYREHSVMLYAVEGSELVRVFDCFLDNDVVSGPARAGRSEHATVRIDRASLPASIHVDLTSEWDPGVSDDARPKDGRPPTEARASDYRFDGHAYVSPSGVCGSASSF
jgi:hypothetical protein